MPDFPENCIRGIRKKDQISQDGIPLAALFNPYSKTTESRTDGGQETSINWEDNDEVLSFTLKYKPSQNENISFPNGAVRVPVEKINNINTFDGTRDSIFYERQPLETNEYHGNIVFKGGLSKTQIGFISTMLAAAASKIFTREDIG